MSFLSREAENDVKVREENKTSGPTVSLEVKVDKGRTWGKKKGLGGKRKGHVCETGTVWYFSCQPEK